MTACEICKADLWYCGSMPVTSGHVGCLSFLHGLWHSAEQSGWMLLIHCAGWFFSHLHFQSLAFEPFPFSHFIFFSAPRLFFLLLSSHWVKEWTLNRYHRNYATHLSENNAETNKELKVLKPCFLREFFKLKSWTLNQRKNWHPHICLFVTSCSRPITQH